MIENINMMVDIIIRLLPWGIIIWVIFILHRHLAYNLCFPFFRYVRFLLVNTNNEIIGPSENYQILVNDKTFKYNWNELTKFPGVSIPVKKNNIVEIMVICGNKIIEHKKINSELKIIKIEVGN